MDIKTLAYRVKAWLRHQLTARNSGGHGIHSPYLFEWVRMVMNDPHRFYAWDKIEQVHERLLSDERELVFVDYGSGASVKGEERVLKVCDIAKTSLSKKKYAQMLARLVNWLGTSDKPETRSLTIVELGTSLGITTAYMAAMDSRNKVVTYEGCSAVSSIARETWKALGIRNIDCRVGEIQVDVLSADLQQVDVVFVDANHTYAGTRAYLNILLEKVHAKSVIVIDDIHYSPAMEQAWREICADERVTSSMDLYQMGMLFFDPHFWKRHYVLN